MARWLNFENHNVLVMGGTSGINLGIAEAFAEQGANVAVASRSQEKVDAAVARLAAFGRRTHGFAADVRDVAALEAGLAGAAEALGGIDTLVVGQAGNFPSAAMQLSPNGFKSVVDIDLLGSFNTVTLAHQHLTAGKANIIAISAPQAFIPMAFQVHVCAAKAGVEMLTRVLAVELGPENIRVNAIVPGPIEDTEGMARLAPTPEAQEQARRSVPMQRYGTAREVADCAMFLASPLAAYISGAIIPVDGGWSVAGAGAGGLMQLQQAASARGD
jgi:NAD(P)-dependent dehydrogenase (short-subunit alcohol dehydrogenase family)